MKKYDCSKVVDYTHEQKRMCKTHKTCWECPLLKRCAYPNQESVDIVQKWSDKHQLKTRQALFLEQYPNARHNEDGVIDIHPCEIDTTIGYDYSCEGKECKNCMYEYWNEEVEE